MKRFYKVMTKKHISNKLIYYAIDWVCEFYGVVDNQYIYLNGRTTFKIITGETAEISE